MEVRNGTTNLSLGDFLELVLGLNLVEEFSGLDLVEEVTGLQFVDQFPWENGLILVQDITWDDGFVLVNEFTWENGLVLVDEVTWDDGLIFVDEVTWDDSLVLVDEVTWVDGFVLVDQVTGDDGLVLVQEVLGPDILVLGDDGIVFLDVEDFWDGVLVSVQNFVQPDFLQDGVNVLVITNDVVLEDLLLNWDFLVDLDVCDDFGDLWLVDEGLEQLVQNLRVLNVVDWVDD